MDFNKLNTVEGADKGAWLHLKHPAYGYPLYTGEGSDEDGQLVKKESANPVRVFVQGMESEAVQNVARELQKNNMRYSDDPEAEGLAIGCALVTNFDGIEMDGEPLAPTKENKIRFFKQSGDLVAQVTTFASNRTNFYKAASKP